MMNASDDRVHVHIQPVMIMVHIQPVMSHSDHGTYTASDVT